ncbi:hypothetical protein LOTGIDRAFT_162387 [Lottia gigantea]|uniref:Granulins domain-containing protein n=1 Tax=Lottia gigantea TaxID=225164 RepID=V4A870_LOTGI|nr:hypothetical protein LOTGIDRAFT_162387 [Lottia gigantea]ESO92907.1 hypothetical protein LOTGIDRAFT_162387 [Lottia gigantea]
MWTGSLLSATILVVMTTTSCNAFLCKWSNEGCSKDDECCSGTCERSHPGMNKRCTKSVLHDPCLFTYHCQSRLHCGAKNRCCSKYWGICRLPTDCCDTSFLCINVKGFHYQRCLPSPVDGCAIKQNISTFISVFTSLYLSYFHLF